MKPIDTRTRIHTLGALLLASAMQVQDDGEHEIIANDAAHRLIPLGVPQATAEILSATAQIKILMEEAACESGEEFLGASAVAVALLYMGDPEQPVELRKSLELLVNRLLNSDDVPLVDFARSGVAMALKAKKLHGVLN